MSRNPQKDNMLAKVFINTRIRNITPEGTRINSIIRDAMLLYPVSESMCRSFVKRFYIDEGLLELRDEVLYVKKETTKG